MKRFAQQVISAYVPAIRAYSTIWLAACVGLGLSLLVFAMLRQQLDAHRTVEFEWVVHNRYRALENGIWRGLDAVRSLADLVLFSSGLEEDNFSIMAESVLRRTQGLAALMWAPRVTGESRSSWEQTANRTQSLKIVERSRHGSLEPAAPRRTHFPVHFLKARATPHLPLGFDLCSEPEIWDALERARGRGGTAVSGRLQIGEEGRQSFGFVVVQPLFRDQEAIAAEAEADNLVGFVVGLFLLSDLTQAAIDPLEPRGVDCLLRDESGKAERQFLDFYASRLSTTPMPLDEASWRAQAAGLSRAIFSVADRQWSVTCAPTPQFRSAEAFGKGPWVALVTGGFFTLLLTSYLVRRRQSLLQMLAMERTLRDSEEVFWQMTETVSEVFWATTPDRSRFLYISPAFEKVWGISCEALYRNAQLYQQSIHPDDLEALLSPLEEMQRTKAPVEAVFRRRRDDGATRWIRERGFPILDDAGELYRIVGFAEDITEERMASEALRRSEKQLRDLFNQSPDIILTVDREGRVLSINRSTPELSADFAIGHDADVLMPAAVRNLFRSTLEGVFTTRKIDHFDFEKADASWWDLRLVPLIQQQATVAVMVIITDVTENRKLQEQAARNARLASVGVLAAGVAHEVNNPNNAILFNTSLLSRAWSDAVPILREYHQEYGDFALARLPFSEAVETLPKLLSQIAMNAKRIQRIVENLKHLSRRDRSELAAEVDVGAALEAAVEILREQIQGHTDHFEFSVADVLPIVRGNSQQLEQVFINVILNALQALPERRRGVFVDASADLVSNSVSIRVRDEGEGISQEHLDSLTEPFFSTREDSGGTGLGLSISQSIIERHGGRITFDSKPGQGTTVTITLPAAVSEEE